MQIDDAPRRKVASPSKLEQFQFKYLTMQKWKNFHGNFVVILAESVRLVQTKKKLCKWNWKLWAVCSCVSHAEADESFYLDNWRLSSGG